MINDTATALKFANNFASVASEIGAGAITTPAAAAARIKQLNDMVGGPAWKELGMAIGSKTRPLKDVSEIKQVFEEVAEGLRAAGGAA